ncbi:MAG: hypothetical protein OXN17_13405 [Candidatus Poribacteria bacterium]|nr:hypothetical protein [Candidatus Poribacteria bacterium]MDE0506030.1 hypothetical protein [Candidatus Poribacteria bacterium]
MKRLFVLTITGAFTVVVAVSVVYGWGANASCWESNGSQYASAMAGSYGLHNGRVHVLARVDTYEDTEGQAFLNNFVSLTAWASSDLDDPARASASVNGLDANNNFQQAQDWDND